mmetsp:Transcript_10951/g.16418  ORF Transcript_10951/g.16418 Transcript_10951/m.16418 type:complete len:100 (-) Transcript_10951:491-790(-)
MPCLCDCLYVGPMEGKCARCVVLPLLFILFLICAVIFSPYIIIGLIGMCIFYPFHKGCEDCCCDTVLYYSSYKMWTTWPDLWKYFFSRRHGGDAEDDIY